MINEHKINTTNDQSFDAISSSHDKVVVKGLLPGTEAWKGMLLNQLMQLSPKMGGNWLPSLKWMFLTDVQTPRHNMTSNKTFLQIQMPNTWDGWLNQLLLANSLVKNSVGNVLGLRTRLA